MAFINDHYLKLAAGYLFPEIARRVTAFADANPSLKGRIIRCGIGDVTEPLPPAAIAAMHAGVEELASRDTFRGYGPATGYDFVREAIVQGDFRERGIAIEADEIFLSDGSKPDASAFIEILAAGSPAEGGNRIAVCDPVYPVYVDNNVMAGNTGAALAGVEPTRGFEASSRVTGNAGINRFNAEVAVGEGWLRVGPAMSTRMAGPPEAMALEAEFLARLKRAGHWRARGDRLRLLDAAGAELLSFHREAPAVAP